MTVADIGAGTDLFTRMFSDAVGTDGRIIAVDNSQKVLDHVQKTSREAGQQNVKTMLCKADSTELPAESVDVAFICDTYHHFEFPLNTMASLHRALKPGGRVILIDFRRVPDKSTDWVLNHVRAGQEVFESEVVQSDFHKTREPAVLQALSDFSSRFWVDVYRTEGRRRPSGRAGCHRSLSRVNRPPARS